MTDKVALVIPGNIWFCPFIKIYTNLFDEWGISYDIISWDRQHSCEENTISYKRSVGQSKISKLVGFFYFSRFVKRTLSKNKYSRLIIFTSQVGIFCSTYLKKNYKGRYIFDFRDLSIEQYRFLKKPFKVLLDNSFANVISSPGFKRYLPLGYDYLLSHNFDISKVEESLKPVGVKIPDNPIEILTIGGIRDYESNAPLMDSVGNNNEFRLSFVGKGPAAQILKDYCLNKGYSNIYFEGFYKKEDEQKYIKNSSFLNIYYPDIKTHASALSNRFYNSLIFRRPMIVTKGQIQGDYCEKLNLGIAVDNIEDLPTQIHSWINETDYDEYENRCIGLLKEFIIDYQKFVKKLESFFKFL